VMDESSPMMTVARSGEAESSVVLTRLESVCEDRGALTVGERIAELRAFLGDDVAAIDREIDRIEALDTPLHQSVRHILSSVGKRLRPMCVVLAARLGTGFSDVARDLAVSAELVHNATLLHDDVVDLGDRRRGMPAARVVYGNAASVFAGDWLLVDALRRIRRTGLPDLLDRALAVLGEMLHAESLQLARRGTVSGDEAAYFEVIEGKTASLFEWAMLAGARAGGLEAPACASLSSYGRKLGVAFQLVDDVLDIDGEEAVIGKTLLTDLREGKLTHPLLQAVRAQPSLGDEIREAVAGSGAELPAETVARALLVMREVEATQKTRALAEALAEEAIDHLSALPGCRGKDALISVAHAVVHRTK